MSSERERIFNFRNVYMHCGKEEMSTMKVLKNRLFILEVIGSFLFLTISILNLSTKYSCKLDAIRRVVTTRGGKKSKDLKG